MPNTTYQLNSIAILGCRGVPAAHSGFETFAEKFALHLVKRGWHVRVYCQLDGTALPYQDNWNGIERYNISVADQGPFGTIIFDWLALKHACQHNFPLLTLGYNTAVFSFLSKLKGIRNVMNMDGIEWKRQKWSKPVQVWFYINEILGCWLTDHLVADHPGIATHLQRWAPVSKITFIPYGADKIEDADPALISHLGIEPGKYALVIGRPEPENSILEIVTAFARVKSDYKFVVLGKFQPNSNAFHREVFQAAGDNTIFPGAIYDEKVVQALRHHTRLYVHGHQVGGTNPSLVEALGCGSPVLAHDNQFNRWVAQNAAEFFDGSEQCLHQLNILLDDNNKISSMRKASYDRHHAAFTWDQVFAEYEKVCTP